MKRRLIAAALMIAVAGPAPAQTYLDKMIARIGRSKKQPATTAAFVPQAMAAVTPTQTAAVDRLLSAPLANTIVISDRVEAVPLIRTLLTVGSCATSSAAWNSVNRFHMTPRTFVPPFYSELVPMDNLKYHDKSRCLDVVRLTDWSKPAANALKFRAYYIAADSGEAKSQTFELQKVADSGWMIREIGVGLN